MRLININMMIAWQIWKEHCVFGALKVAVYQNTHILNWNLWGSYFCEPWPLLNNQGALLVDKQPFSNTELSFLPLRRLYGEGDTITRHISCTSVSEYTNQWFVCLAKLQNPVDLNYEISIHSLKYKEMAKYKCKRSPNNG